MNYRLCLRHSKIQMDRCFKHKSVTTIWCNKLDTKQPTKIKTWSRCYICIRYTVHLTQWYSNFYKRKIFLGLKVKEWACGHALVTDMRLKKILEKSFKHWDSNTHYIITPHLNFELISKQARSKSVESIITIQSRSMRFETLHRSSGPVSHTS